MKYKDAKEFLLSLYKGCRRPVFIWGPPGIGKTAMVYDICRQIGGKLFEFRAIYHEPTDMTGCPTIEVRRVNIDGQAKDIKVTTFCPPDFLPHDGHGIFYCDELGYAKKEMVLMLMQLFWERCVNNWRLPDGFMLIATSNRKEHCVEANRLNLAFLTRVIHIDLELDLDSWMEWALTHDIHPTLRAWVQWKPNVLNPDMEEIKKRAPDQPFACGRSIEIASDALKDVPRRLWGDAISGILGPDGADFLYFVEVWDKLPKLDDLLADPENHPLSKAGSKEKGADAGLQFALATALADYGAQLDRNTARDRKLLRAIAIVNSRLSEEAQFCLMRQLARRNSKALQVEEIINWWDRHKLEAYEALCLG